MNDNFSAKKIQNDLIKLTGKKFSLDYIENKIKKIFEKILKSKKKKILISGAQGCGKTTLLKLIKINFKKFYNIDPLCISLDDYYLTKNQRIKMSKKIHPLFITRGVPGTHQISKIIETIDSFDKKKYPIKLPKFNKLIDDRYNYSQIIKSKKDILILEGWCCGCSPIKNKYLKKNINIIENSDYDLKWRNYFNKKLMNDYRILFKKFKYLIYFKILSFDHVLDWRLKQEKNLKSTNSVNNYVSKKNINKFIMHYEKITIWMMKETSKIASILIKIDKKQTIKKIITK